MALTPTSLMCLMAFALKLAAAEPSLVSAVVMEIAKPVSLRRARAQTIEINLIPENSVGLPLFGGDTIVCGPGGRATLLLRTGAKQELGSSQVFTVTNWVASKADKDAHRSAVLMDSLSDRLGRVRDSSDTDLSWWPSSDCSVRPATAELRWNSRNLSGALRIKVIPDGRYTPVFQSNQIEASAGSFKDPGLNRKLEEYQSADKPVGMELTINSSNKVAFSVLSKDAEEKWQEEMHAWKGSPEWLNALGRAETCVRYRLFKEGADELERALALPPASNSEALRTRLIEIYDHIGNSERAETLRSLKRATVSGSRQ